MATTDPVKPSKSQAKSPQPADKKNGEAARQADAAAVRTAANAQAAETQADAEEEYEEFAPPGRRFLLFTAAPSWMISLIFHMIALFILATLSIPQPDRSATELTVNPPDPAPEEVDQFELDQMVEVPEMVLNESTVGPTDATITQLMPVDVPDMQFSTDLDAAPIKIDLAEFAERAAPKNVLAKSIGTATGTGLAGRGAAMRSEMIKQAGGTQGSEAAVAMALKWLAYHQLPDGGWSFDHTIGPGARLSPNPGSLREARNAATAMALLPFLGAGQTHLEGEYKETVARGLYFLSSQQKTNGSFHESGGQMYSHGLCAIALCEAYAMTQDPKLGPAAQGSLNFIVYAQDPVGGGWRYAPRGGGDTSVVGWQLMALKSGHMAYLQVPPGVITGAGRFLDSVQSDSGAKYGYASPGAGPATTAVGLLCRMYMGWKQEHPALERGVQHLGSMGPSTGNMYYNYYATQVMRHYGGEPWEKWNTEMRDYLVKTQSTDGPARGSWFIPGDHGSERGGRLYCTSMATMVLEVYYRHMPIYGDKAAEEEFPL